MWSGENGSSWKLIDNGTVIHEASLTANSPSAQSGNATVTVSSVGSHTLIVSLCNGSVCTDSDPKTVNVSDPNVAASPWDYLDNADWLTRKANGMGGLNQPYNNTSGKMVGAYFVEWGVYGRAFYPKNIPVENLTHIFYGFIPVCGPNDSLQDSNPSGYGVLVQQCEGKADYEVTVHDKFAALEKGDMDGTGQWDDEVSGLFAEMYRIKMTYPHVKILPSVGGWTLSDPLFEIGINPTARATFITSIIDFIKKYDFFDGVDIDWEFPGGGGANPLLGTAQDGDGFATLMIELRAALDALSLETGRTYELTAAVNAGVSKISKINWEQAAPAMDYINLMSYDYYGAWNTLYGHQTGIYDTNDLSTPTDGNNIHDTVTHLLGRNVAASKIAVGVAMYGRGWEGIQGGDANGPFDGTATGGTAIKGTDAQGIWEDGIIDYKSIEANMMGGAEGTGVNGFSVFFDNSAKASYVWNPSTGTFISMDTKSTVVEKGNYVNTHQLGGVFAWEIDADSGTILNAMHQGLGHPQQ